MRKILIFIIIVFLLNGCVPDVRNFSLEEMFPGTKFSGELLVNVSSNKKLLYYETISIIVRNTTEENLFIDSPENIYGFYYSDESLSWVKFNFSEVITINHDTDSFPIKVEAQSEVIILINPDIFFVEKVSKIQIVVLAQSLMKDYPEKFGGIIKFDLYPFEGINMTSIQIKEMVPDLEMRAKKWQNDAYISAISLYIPPEWAPNSNVAKITFQSDTNKIEELSFSIENNGTISEQYATYFDGVIKNRPIADNLWLKDGSEIMQILIAFDASIEIPSKSCEGVNLRYNPKNELEWVYYVSDCKLILKEKYYINPITGVISLTHNTDIP